MLNCEGYIFQWVNAQHAWPEPRKGLDERIISISAANYLCLSGILCYLKNKYSSFAGGIIVANSRQESVSFSESVDRMADRATLYDLDLAMRPID